MIESRQLNHTNGRRHVFWYLDCAAVKVRKRLYVTGRDQEDVLLLLSQRKTVPDIERELFISNSTAKTHCKNIYKKLGIHKREELLVLMEHPSVAPEKGPEEEDAS